MLEAYRECRIHRKDGEEAGLSEQGQKLATQIKLANTEMARLLDAYQAGAIQLPELQKRRRLVDAKLDTLHREKELLEKMAREQKQESDVQRDLEEFRALVSDRAQHSSFEDKQKLMRMVLDKVVVKDWRVDVHYNITLSRPAASREEKVSTNFDLCNARHESSQGPVAKLGHWLCGAASLRAASSRAVVEADRGSRGAAAGRVLLSTTGCSAGLAPGRAAGSVGREPETERDKITAPDSFDRSDSRRSADGADLDSASLPQQAATVDVQRFGDRHVRQWAIPVRGRTAATC